MNIQNKLLLTIVILVSLSGVVSAPAVENNRISFYTTIEGPYSLTIQSGNTIDGSEGNTHINDYYENRLELNGQDITVDLHYDDGRSFHGVFPSTIDGNYDITPR
jgi:tricorn protease-like protein